jgi:hypothetical protein
MHREPRAASEKFPQEFSAPHDESGMSDFNIPLGGIARAFASVDATADRLSRNSGLLSALGQTGDIIDLSAEMVALMQARNDVEMNVKVAQTLQEMNGQVLDILA